MKKKLAAGFACVLVICLITGTGLAASGSLALTAQPLGSGGYVALSWTNSDTSQPYYYMIAKSDDNGTSYQTIPLKNTAKVLNIYPGAGTAIPGTDLNGRQLVTSASAGEWMETDGFGKGLITVDCLLIDDFNSDPSHYLFRQADGSYNYDVVFIGSWDSNRGADGVIKDITAVSETVLQDFIDAGGGYLGGHDTANGTWTSSERRLNALAEANLNMLVGPSLPMYGKTTIPGTINLAVIKRGSLVNYPWSLSALTLTIPSTHTTRQFAMGDVWMEFTTNSTTGYEITSYGGHTGTNNFYLTTWNNTAMIQTGHSNGSATDGEKKVLANALLYLSQISGETSFDDHTGQDINPPDSVSGSEVVVSVGVDRKAAITFSAPGDNGNTYFYKLKAMGVTDGSETWSDPVSCTVTSGINGYAIAVDQNPTTDPGDTVTATECGCNTDTLAVGTWYVHIKAIDNAGNAGETTHVQFVVTNKALASNNIVEADPAAAAPGNVIILTATGDRQDAEGEVAGDERYIPVSWVSTETGKAGNFTLNGGEYTSIYTPSASGSYTVTATFKKQTFDGLGWADTVDSDTRAKNVGVYTLASASGNSVSADDDSITAGHTIVLSAAGDRQGSAGRVPGDERYIPVSWASGEAGKTGTFTLSGGTYRSAYKPSSPGRYTVTATFKKQVFDGTAWKDEGSTDLKMVSVRVYAEPVPETTETEDPAPIEAPTPTASPIPTIREATEAPVPTVKQTEEPSSAPAQSSENTAAFGSIVGTIFSDDGKPVEGVTIELHSDPVVSVTDANGRFMFENVALTEHTLFIFVGGRNVREIPLSFHKSDVFSTSETQQGVSISFTPDTAKIDITLVMDTGLSSVQLRRVKEIRNASYWWWILAAAFITAAAVYLIWYFKRAGKAQKSRLL